MHTRRFSAQLVARVSHLLLLSSLLLASLACRAATRALEPRPTFTLSPTASVAPTSTATPLPASPTPSPSSTPTPTPNPTATPRPTASEIQLQVFEELWQAVNENYLYPDFNGLDWDAIHEEYRQRVEAGMSDEMFYLAMDEMLFRLGDEHSAYFSPQEAAELDASYAGEYDYVGIGVYTSVVPERERVVVILVFPGSPAALAGLKAHDSILAVDGHPIYDEIGFRRDLLLGPEGTTVELVVETPSEAPRKVSITRERITGKLPVPYQLMSTPGGKRIGYLLLVTFNDSMVDDQVGAALRAMTADGPLDGLIIDNRFNGGGASEVLGDTLAYFVDGVFGAFVRREEEGPIYVEGVDVNGSLELPLVILIGKDTASFGEVFAGVLQDLGRAYLIGETTDGNVEILSVFSFSDGSRAWIAYQTFRPLNNSMQDWEETGIVPDLTVTSAWDQSMLEDDPAIQAALDYFDR